MKDRIRNWLQTEKHGIGRALLAFMALGFACLALAVLAAFWVTARTAEHTRWVNHTYQVEVTIGRLRWQIEQSETARRGYMLMPTNPAFVGNYHQAADFLLPTLDELAALTSDNEQQRPHIAKLRGLIEELLDQQRVTNRLTQRGQAETAIASFRADTLVKRLRFIRNELGAMSDSEQALLKVRDQAQSGSVRAFYITLTLAGLLLILVAAVSLITILRYTRDLNTSRGQLQDLAESLEDQVTVRTADLSRANEEIQRFAYIVSHDLRAPLVNVMGFTAELDTATQAIAELIDRAEDIAPQIVTEEARFAAREDLPEAIGFIRTSTAKMDRLINAILKLSREGRRVLTPEPIDLAQLGIQIRDTIQHQLDEAGATLEIQSQMPLLVSDRLAVEQILSNLIENASKYLAHGRPGRIALRAHRAAGRVIIEVEDNGRGVDPKDHGRIFDLFRRSGAQDKPGEGIGLAHVRAMAYRLGGVIDIQSELDQGAIFRLNLPTTLTDQQDDRS